MPDEGLLDPRTKSASQMLDYQIGLGNEFLAEALPNALPHGQNSPQIPPYGLYAEELTGTAFTAPRASNRRSWMYRIRPSAGHSPFREIDLGLLRSAPLNEAPTPPSQLRWEALAMPEHPADFLEGLMTYAASGDVALQAGHAVHFYGANRSMQRAFYNADGEMMFVPQQGRLRLVTEFGILEIEPQEIAVVPRGIKFRVELPDGAARGFVCENYGQAFRLPELGPIGSQGLANSRDFLTPVAAFEDVAGPHELIAKFQGRLWSAEMDHSPMDVVAWHGSFAPYKYDCRKFNTLNTVSYDHPDPSIFTVLSSPSDTPGVANVELAIFPPRWMVAEHTFRPPPFHRNIMSEMMVMIHGVYDGKAGGFLPGGASLHNSLTAHGPDAGTVERGSNAELKPVKIEDTMACLFEGRYAMQVSRFALEAPELQQDYWTHWRRIGSRFTGSR